MTINAVAGLRSAERAFLDTGEEEFLDQAEALLAGELATMPFAVAARMWWWLHCYDRSGNDRYLEAAIERCAARGWADPALFGVSVGVLLRRCARDGDLTDLDRAIELGGGMVPASGSGAPVGLTRHWRSLDLATARLERYRLGDRADDLRAAIDLMRRVVPAAREPVVQALCLGRLASCEQEQYLSDGGRRHLDRAIRRYHRALTMVGARSVVRPMLMTDLGTALQDRFAEDEDVVDIDQAVDLATQAVAASSPGPDLACHLVNLGTALNTRYAHASRADDLDRALAGWQAAVDALPPASPYRPAFLDRLALGFGVRWESEHGHEQDLDQAIECGRAAVRQATPTSNAAVYAGHLAAALEHRFELHRDPDDLHEAVRVFRDTVDGPRVDGARTPDVVANLAHSYLARYQVLGDPADVDDALAALGGLGRLARSQRATVAASTARALALRYQTRGDPDDLVAAIAAARRGLTGVEATSSTWNSRTARLAHLLYLRYQCRGRRRDLDQAIRLLRDVVREGGDGREASADQVSQLAMMLAARYERGGATADRDAAVDLSRRARQLDRGGDTPHLAANLASALHERFIVDGRLDELDEAIDRHRAAAAAEASTAPTYPTVLNNLGLALQDNYVYRDDDAALDEAVALHEQAVARCSPGAPDRSGYLSTLAAAFQLRYERDERPADLDLVIQLDEEALASMGSNAPERLNFLANLGSARHARARRTGVPAELHQAIETLRSALRRVRPGQPARVAVLRNYASALADGRYGRAQVLRAYQTAVAASVDAPAQRLDVATALAEWALRAGLWEAAGDACHAAAQARRLLFGTQVESAHRDTWLSRGEQLSVAEALANIHCGRTQRAVAALDAGRALWLSEVLDARTAADRLRAAGHRALAARYQRATELLARAHAAHRRRITPSA